MWQGKYAKGQWTNAVGQCKDVARQRTGNAGQFQRNDVGQRNYAVGQEKYAARQRQDAVRLAGKDAVRLAGKDAIGNGE